MITKHPTNPRRLEPLLGAFARAGLSTSYGYRLIKAGAFVRPVKVGRMSYVLASEVDEWIDARVAERDAAPMEDRT